MTEIVLMGIAGKALTFLIQKFAKNLSIKSVFLNKLFDCSLCLGFWIFLLLSLTLRVSLFSDVFYSFGVSEIMTAGLMTFAVFLMSMGFWEFFGKIYVIKE